MMIGRNTYRMSIVPLFHEARDGLAFTRDRLDNDGRIISERATLSWTPIDPGMFWEPENWTMREPFGVLPELLKSALGKDAPSQQQIDAMNAHLQDMRALVFKDRKIDRSEK